jgi:hypothetical protein
LHVKAASSQGEHPPDPPPTTVSRELATFIAALGLLTSVAVRQSAVIAGGRRWLALSLMAGRDQTGTVPGDGARRSAYVP